MVGKGDLREKTIKGLFWSFTDILTNQGIQFIVLMILARILTPEHFGMIGMVTVFITISNSLIDSGFSQALIREKEVNRSGYSTIFIFNLIASCTLYIIMYSSAPIISAFFGVERLVSIIRVLGIGLIINSLSVIQRVFLIRKIDFRKQTFINLFSTSIAGVISIKLAFNGYGVWSLVAQTLILQTMQTVLLWISNRWLPTPTFDFKYFRRLYNFGSKLLVSGIIDTIYNNIIAVIIGKLYFASQLGFYTNAAKLSDVITNSITGALQRVTYPVLSSIQEDNTRLMLGFRKIIGITSFVMFPIMTGLIAVADSLIPLLLGTQWSESIIYFQLLCIGGMIYPIHAINLNILQVKGRSDLFLKLEIIKKSLLTLLIVASLFLSMGVIGLIVAAILSSYISLFINTYYSAKELSYSVFQQLKDLLPSFSISLIMGGCICMVGKILVTTQYISLVIQIILGIFLYGLISWIFKLREFELLTSYFNGLFQKRKSKILRV